MIILLQKKKLKITFRQTKACIPESYSILYETYKDKDAFRNKPLVNIYVFFIFIYLCMK